jgi:prepilin-type N-terminal cleavage/methylation domain-containing protein
MIRSRQGFTILELLVVIGIIGILASVAFWQLGSIRKNAELQNAQLGFVQDMDRGRQNARRYNVNYAVRIDTTNSKYSIVPVKDSTPNGAGPTWVVLTASDGDYPQIKDKVLPYSAKFTLKSGITKSYSDNFVMFTAPFARVNADADCVAVNIGTLKGEVNLVGVTGKPIPRPIRTGNGSDYCATN